MRTSIFIAAPYSRGFEGGSTVSLAGAVADLSMQRFGTEVVGCAAASIATQRDFLCDRFLKTNHTHILFVDSDMLFPKHLARRLLSFELPFVGTIYTKREIDLAKVIAAAKAGKPNPEAHGYTYNYKALPEGKLSTTKDGLCRIAAIGFGFVLIRRDCLEKMKPNAPVYYSGFASADVSGFFQLIMKENKLVHEDYSFCQRWREVGGEVIAYADADIKHIGTFNFGVPFSHAARAGAL
jgi:hypothetical protein